MLLHHASASASLAAIVINAASNCLSSMQDRHVSSQERVRTATLVALLGKSDTQKEALLHMRSNGCAAPQLLRTLLLNRTADVSARKYAAKSLKLLTNHVKLAQVGFWLPDEHLIAKCASMHGSRDYVSTQR